MEEPLSDPVNDPKAALLDAALMHVPFDGWSDQTFRAAVADAGVDATVARAACPRGAVDLAVAYHLRGDAVMREKLAQADLSSMRFRDRIAAAVKFRLQSVEDKEAVRRGTTLFALPPHRQCDADRKGQSAGPRKPDPVQADGRSQLAVGSDQGTQSGRAVRFAGQLGVAAPLGRGKGRRGRASHFVYGSGVDLPWRFERPLECAAFACAAVVVSRRRYCAIRARNATDRR